MSAGPVLQVCCASKAYLGVPGRWQNGLQIPCVKPSVRRKRMPGCCTPMQNIRDVQYQSAKK